MGVAARFESFLANLKLTDQQKASGMARKESVVSTLNTHYWGITSPTVNSSYVGSWAKRTRIRPPRDVDVLFELPSEVHNRFEGRSGNKQSQLLQEVRSVLNRSYPSTDVRGDGPVVLIPFSTYNIELIPAFSLIGGGHWICLTDSGGRYKKADYAAKSSQIITSNVDSSGNTRDLIRMMKCWQAYCSVSLKSYYIELLSVAFMLSWEYKGKSKVYYDYMCRDFLSYIVGRKDGYVFAPGTNEAMSLGSAWLSRAESALGRAKLACIYEGSSEGALAGDEWQKIFGVDILKYV